MKAKRFISLLVICCMFLLPMPAFATDYYAENPEYVHTSTPSTTVESTEILWANTSNHSAATLTTLVIKTLIQSGDQVSMEWYDSSGNYFDSDAINGSTMTINAPSGAYGAKLVLETGSEAGDRWAWFSSGANSLGNTTYFPDPDTSGSGGGDDNDPIDFTPVVDELQNLQGQLSTIQGQFNNATSQLTAIQGQMNTIQGQISTVQGQFETVIDQLDTVQGQINTLDNHVVDIHDYLSTPRTSQPMTVNIPQVTIDPTPPPVEEPYQQPYQYDRATGQYELPPMVDSPGPLPLIPDPVTMEHDLPAVIDQPIQADQPVQIDPANVEDPIIRDPINMEQPIVQEPVRIEQPIAQDPPMREEPKQLTPFSPEPPIPKSPIINRSEPLNSEAPFTPDPPLTPNPPI